MAKLFRIKNIRKMLFQKKKKKKKYPSIKHSPIIPQLLLRFFTKKKNSQNFPFQNRAFIAGKNVFQTVFRRFTSNPTRRYRGLHNSIHALVARVRMSVVVTCSFHRTKNRVETKWKASSCAILVYSREKKAGQSFVSIFLSPIRRAAMKVYEEDYREMA